MNNPKYYKIPNSVFHFFVRPLGLRTAPSLTPAQAYAARWDLSPYPLPRPMPIIPRGATIEPSPQHFSMISGAVPFHTNLVQKSSSIKERRSSSKVVPLLLANRSVTFDESHLVNLSQLNTKGKAEMSPYILAKLPTTPRSQITTQTTTTNCLTSFTPRQSPLTFQNRDTLPPTSQHISVTHYDPQTILTYPKPLFTTPVPSPSS